MVCVPSVHSKNASSLDCCRTKFNLMRLPSLTFLSCAQLFFSATDKLHCNVGWHSKRYSSATDKLYFLCYNLCTRDGAQNDIIKTSHFVGSFFCSFENLEAYPFDTETCSIKMRIMGNDYDFTKLLASNLEYSGKIRYIKGESSHPIADLSGETLSSNVAIVQCLRYGCHTQLRCLV